MKKATLLWIDLEMTGLDPEKDRILEVAAIATNMSLKNMATYEAVVKVSDKLIKERMVGEFWENNSTSRDALQAQPLVQLAVGGQHFDFAEIGEFGEGLEAEFGAFGDDGHVVGDLHRFALQIGDGEVGGVEAALFGGRVTACDQP